jgi:DNA-3-methyladenine glycosylase I
MTREWGHEEYYQTDSQLFEKLSLEGAQSGLSWRTILHKREAYRKAFHYFDINTVASMTGAEIDKLIAQQSDDARELVVRHRNKLESVVHNAKIIQSLKANGEISSFKEYIWSFVSHKPILNRWKSFKDIPSKTPESEAMSKDLKKKGMKFVGPTTAYAFMQSCGLVIDHPFGTKGWMEAEERLKVREGGYYRR